MCPNQEEKASTTKKKKKHRKRREPIEKTRKSDKSRNSVIWIYVQRKSTEKPHRIREKDEWPIKLLFHYYYYYYCWWTRLGCKSTEEYKVDNFRRICMWCLILNSVGWVVSWAIIQFGVQFILFSVMICYTTYTRKKKFNWHLLTICSRWRHFLFFFGFKVDN